MPIPGFISEVASRWPIHEHLFSFVFREVGQCEAKFALQFSRDFVCVCVFLYCKNSDLGRIGFVA